MIRFMKTSDTAIIPTLGTDGAAGFDLYADNAFPISVGFGGVAVVPLGIAMAIPAGWAGIIHPRSGLAARHGLDALGVFTEKTFAGLIDSDYRGSVFVVLTIAGTGTRLVINRGDRIAQIVFSPVETQSIEVESLEDTVRGSGGFGSTGTR